jgi:DNA-binding response OmpR family regulator
MIAAASQMVRDRNAEVPIISTVGPYAERRVDSRVIRDARTPSRMTVLSDRQRILIVDDDPGLRTMLESLFAMHGFHVTVTDSVLGASELVERFQPHVILLDLALPYRSGASWLAQLKSNPATARIPVVILSALPEVLPRSRRRLAQAIVSKPFRSRALVDTVLAVCGGITLTDSVATADSGSTQPLGLL